MVTVAKMRMEVHQKKQLASQVLREKYVKVNRKWVSIEAVRVRAEADWTQCRERTVGRGREIAGEYDHI